MSLLFCSECGALLTVLLAHSEDGQEDYPWCEICVDYVDGVEEVNAKSAGKLPGVPSK